MELSDIKSIQLDCPECSETVFVQMKKVNQNLECTDNDTDGCGNCGTLDVRASIEYTMSFNCPECSESITLEYGETSISIV